MITNLFVWMETRLDQGGWVRRAYLLLATAMTWKVVLWAMEYADKNSARPGADVAMVIAAVAAIVAAVQTFAFNAYLKARSEGQ